MKLSFTIMVAALALLLSTITTVSGQVAGQVADQVTCSCEAPDRVCKDGKCVGCKLSVTCQGGCTAVCGTHDACYLSCRRDILNARITVHFFQKTGNEIASVLSERTKKKIEFLPFNKQNRLDKHNYKIDNDDVFNILHFLYLRGQVKVNGVDFETFEKIFNSMTKGRKMSVNFDGIPVKDALARLSFLSRLPFRVKSGDSEKLLSMSLQEVTLDQIVASISKETGVTIEEGPK